MDINTAFTMDQAQTNKLRLEMDGFNKKLNDGRVFKKELDKDDFLKILLTQLTHQDPTKPLEDKQFIAQMAQFSTLEQITNMNNEITSMADVLSGNQAFSILGKFVELPGLEEGHLVKGQVEKVTGGQNPQVMVNGEFYNYHDIITVSNEMEEASL